MSARVAPAGGGCCGAARRRLSKLSRVGWDVPLMGMISTRHLRSWGRA